MADQGDGAQRKKFRPHGSVGQKVPDRFTRPRRDDSLQRAEAATPCGANVDKACSGLQVQLFTTISSGD